MLGICGVGMAWEPDVPLFRGLAFRAAVVFGHHFFEALVLGRTGRCRWGVHASRCPVP